MEPGVLDSWCLLSLRLISNCEGKLKSKYWKDWMVGVFKWTNIDFCNRDYSNGFHEPYQTVHPSMDKSCGNFFSFHHILRKLSGYCFLTYETELVLFLVVLENFVLPIGWDSSHMLLKVTSELLISEVICALAWANDIRRRLLWVVKCHKWKKWQIIFNNF